jgi:hypothetical protein
MAIKSNPEINVYEKIIDSHKIINAWKSEEVFPVDKMIAIERLDLEKIMVTEIIFEGTSGRSEEFDVLFSNVIRYLHNLLFAIGFPVYVFEAEFKSQNRNRIRTYKGIVPKNLNKEDFIQSEITLSSGYSIFGAVIRLNEDNYMNILDLFTGSANSFVIGSNEDGFFQLNTIDNLVKNYMEHNSTSEFNFLKLAMHYCLKDDILIRIGGDGGDRYVSIQIFSLKSRKEIILNATNSAL